MWRGYDYILGPWVKGEVVPRPLKAVGPESALALRLPHSDNVVLGLVT